MADLVKETADWIGNYYNSIRRHSSLGYMTPDEYELGYREGYQKLSNAGFLSLLSNCY